MAKKQSESASVSDRLARLLSERERYAQWLEKLEEERDSTPDHVYERVREDYTARLEEATEKLGSHVEAIESTLDARLEKLEQLSEAVEARTDELLEAEVRFRVGELDEEAWAEKEKEHKTAVTRAERKRDKVRDDVERLEAALERIRDGAEDGGKQASRSGKANGRKESKARGDDARSSETSGEARDEARPDPIPFRTVECTRCGTFNVEGVTHCEACGTEMAGS